MNSPEAPGVQLPQFSSLRTTEWEEVRSNAGDRCP